MNNFSSSPSAVPSIRIHGADDPSALYVHLLYRPVPVSSSLFSFDGGEIFPADINLYLEQAGLYTCSQDFQSDCKLRSIYIVASHSYML